ncbi:hypothetical protein Acsp02_85200 [Actinoplanes sp. NBRC 103695]|nr:hypothetical protein Acsp02_85200 [Actinoplanes sp. NBRC 103695]
MLAYVCDGYRLATLTGSGRRRRVPSAWRIADTYPLTSVAELIGRGIPTVVVPFVNAALAARAPFQRALANLRAEGVRVVSGPDDNWEPHPPGEGTETQELFPWRMALQLAEEAAHRRVHP